MDDNHLENVVFFLAFFAFCFCLCKFYVLCALIAVGLGLAYSYGYLLIPSGAAFTSLLGRE